MANFQDTFITGSLVLRTGSISVTPGADREGAIYVKTDGRPYFSSSQVTETDMTAVGAATIGDKKAFILLSGSATKGNIALGDTSIMDHIDLADSHGYENIAIGSGSMQNSTGSYYNVSIGHRKYFGRLSSWLQN